MSGRPGHIRASGRAAGTRVVAGVRIAWQALPPGGARREIADGLIARVASEMIANAETFASETNGSVVAVGRRCERCGGTDHGRPTVLGAPIHASVSYTPDLVVAAVAEECQVVAIGIDAEQSTRARLENLRGIVTPGQRTSLRRWTRIEAVLKADGRGLSVEPRRVQITRSLFGVHGSVTDGGESTERGALGIRPRLRRVRGPRGVVISLAVASV